MGTEEIPTNAPPLGSRALLRQRWSTVTFLHLRLYSIDKQGRRGVVFLSLEASHLIPVLVARAMFGLNYRWANMKLGQRDGAVAYRTRRHGQPDAASHIIVRPGIDSAANASLAADPVSTFVTARWGFHETHFGRTIYSRNHHEPWRLQRAELLDLDDGLRADAGHWVQRETQRCGLSYM